MNAPLCLTRASHVANSAPTCLTSCTVQIRWNPSAPSSDGSLRIVSSNSPASFIARLLQRYRWIAYVGLVIILYVAGEMIYRGALEVWPHLQGRLGT